MNKILSKDEVDALLTGVSDGEVDTEPDKTPASAKAIPYDFTDRSTYLQSRPLNLEAVNDRLAKLLGVSFATALRRPANTSTKEVELKKLSEFTGALTVPTSLHLFKMEPLPGLGMLALDSSLAFSLLETFFGAAGPGQSKVEERDFTTIENKLIHKVVTLALADLEKAWEPVHSLSLTLERSESNPQFAELADPHEVIISIKFEVQLDEPIGLMTFCIPYSSLEPIRQRLQTPYNLDEQESESEWAEVTTRHLKQATVEMAVEVGKTQIPARQLLELSPGDVLVLDKDYTEPLLVKVEDVPKLYAFAGLSKGKKAFKVNDFIEDNQ